VAVGVGIVIARDHRVAGAVPPGSHSAIPAGSEFVGSRSKPAGCPMLKKKIALVSGRSRLGTCFCLAHLGACKAQDSRLGFGDSSVAVRKSRVGPPQRDLSRLVEIKPLAAFSRDRNLV
jgi:hypothetical protein